MRMRRSKHWKGSSDAVLVVIMPASGHRLKLARSMACSIWARIEEHGQKRESRGPLPAFLGCYSPLASECRWCARSLNVALRLHFSYGKVYSAPMERRALFAIVLLIASGIAANSAAAKAAQICVSRLTNCQDHCLDTCVKSCAACLPGQLQ